MCRIIASKLFFCSQAFFRHWAENRKSLRMEFFYHEMRKKTGFLMEGEHPVGGKWNFDAENRKKLSGQETIPERLRFPPDAITNEVIQLVTGRFKDHFGDIEPFGWAVTRNDALQALDALDDTVDRVYLRELSHREQMEPHARSSAEGFQGYHVVGN